MNDVRPWPKRNPESPTGRFIIPAGCKCRMCNEPLPWRTLGWIAGALGLLLWAFYS
jgi:hypothetical protein